MKPLLTALVFWIFCYCHISAQVPVGAWRDHLSYNRASHVAVTGSRVYCATGAGMIVYNKEDNSLEKFSRVHGLSDVDIRCIKWSDLNGALIVGYANGNLDILSDNRIVNLTDIVRSSVTGSKSINNIMVLGHQAYLSCSFGIVVVNIEKNEIEDTYFLGDGGTRLAVNDMAFDGKYLYAATQAGLYRADINSPNLLDFSSWSLIDFLPDAGSLFSSLAWFEGNLYAVQLEGSGQYVSYRIEEESWEYFTAPAGAPTKFVVSGNHLGVIRDSQIEIFGPGLSLVRIIDDYGFWGKAMRDIEVEEDGNTWIADRIHGLVRSAGSNYHVLTPPGPYSNRVFSISSYPERTYFAAGGYNQAFGNLFLNGEYSVFSEGSWHSRLNYDIRDVIYVREHPEDPETIFLATWGYGVAEYRDGNLYERFVEENSSLQSIIPGADFIRTGGMAFDKGNNLWVTNTGVPNPVSVRKADGEWLSFPFGGIINHDYVGEILITETGQKWVLLPKGGGLFVFDNHGNPGGASGIDTRKLSIIDENGGLISNEVSSIAEDKNGFIWVGTNTGVVVYYNPGRVFSDEDFFARRIVVSGTREEDIGYLLNNETVTAIAVDGADRKWFGTEKSGVFLVSSDGKNQVHHFTVENSPLLSNNISDIAIGPSSGEVFFGTAEGVVSFRGEAIDPNEKFSNVYVFPNPVREDYSGPVTITGLVKDSIVKITDISGNLVYETISLGGQATWDGRNSRGRRVRTGIYLVFLSAADGSETYVTKLMFIH
ncbi:MAG: two-component regulator propeller domain-containing protein [Bacteroidales bacterium]